MTGDLNPLASQHVPFFITSPGETDQMIWTVGIFMVGLVMLAGVLYFKLHALPEHLSHGRASKTQFEIVGVLALLALFTHNGMFWVAALILAMVRIPNFEAPLNVMARALMRLAGHQAPHSAPPAPEAEEASPADPDMAMPDLPTTAEGK
jgi:hypothetical protein